MFESINRPSRWRTFWPDVRDISGAREAIRLATWFAYLGAILTAIATVVTLLSGGAVVELLVSTILFGLIGWGIHHGLRAAAMFAAVSVGGSMLLVIAQGRFPGVVTPFLLVGFINGVRGTFALKKHERAAAADVTTT